LAFFSNKYIHTKISVEYQLENITKTIKENEKLQNEKLRKETDSINETARVHTNKRQEIIRLQGALI
jgi:hypothetical protein